ncbi:hypothetical protein F4808DRAFT_465288 [Astrocystis sublimbata]|nr:hypothetical protein F4808DRAFT_465288 [Astrocystis sublimbata]
MARGPCDESAVAGGCEQLKHKVVQSYIDELHLNREHQLEEFEKSQIFDFFNKSLSTLTTIEGCNSIKWQIRQDDGSIGHIKRSSADVTEMYNSAMKKPLDVARERIREAAKDSRGQAQVVVTGGTAKSKWLQHQMRQLCANNGLQPPIFLHDRGLSDLNARIAEGAAYAYAHPLSVERFLEAGAAFGLQTFGTKVGEKPKDRRWNHSGEFLFSRGFPDGKVQIQLFSHTLLRLVCQCHFSGRPCRLDIYDCYNLATLPQFRPGRYEFSISFTKSEGEMKFSIKVEREATKRAQASSRREEFPLHINLGSRTLHLGTPSQSEEEITAQLENLAKVDI